MRLFSSLLMLAVVGLGWSLMAADPAANALTNCKCPVSGKAVSIDKVSDFGGGKVYFCCDGCKGKFDADSSTFANKARQQMVVSGQFAQQACPFSGGPVKAGTEIEVAAAKVGFCCGNCKAKAEKAMGDDQINLIFAEAAFTKGFVKK